MLRQRPTEGFLGGLWEFPAVDLSPGLKPEQTAARLLSDLGLHGELNKSSEIRHAYSHFKLELTVFRTEVNPAEIIAERSAHRWCGGTELESLPLHGAHRKAYNLLKNDADLLPEQLVKRSVIPE